MPVAEDVQNINKYQYWDINSGMLFPQQFSISISAAENVDMTMGKGFDVTITCGLLRVPAKCTALCSACTIAE